MATKEERFILTLYKKAKEKGDLSKSFDRYDIGRTVGFNSKSVDGMCAMLFQANFIKKIGEKEIYLTANGIALGQTLLGEN